MKLQENLEQEVGRKKTELILIVTYFVKRIRIRCELLLNKNVGNKKNKCKKIYESRQQTKKK